MSKTISMFLQEISPEEQRERDALLEKVSEIIEYFVIYDYIICN